MKLSKLFVFAFVILGLLSFSLNVSAQTSELRKAKQRVDSASKVLQQVMRAEDKAIPKDILERAKAVVVFPGVVKAAFIVGGQGGKGVVVSRTANGWSAPAFLNMGGGSVGFQIGAQKTDYVLLIMNDEGLKGLLEDKFEMGGEASIAAGPVGRTAAASTNATLDAGILTYSRSKGAFAGISLKGVVISQDQDINQAVYKKSAKDLLINSMTPWTAAPKNLQKFSQTVAMYAK